MPARASSRRREPGLAARAWGRAVDALFPPLCLLCGEPCPAGGEPVCPSCTASLPWITGPTCERCGIELISERRQCTRCRRRELAFDRNVALFPYLGRVRDLIHLYKTSGHRSLAGYLSELLGEAYRREYEGAAIVPVPGRLEVRRRRGWEHIELLASGIERRFGAPVERCLVRRGGRAQKALDYEGRLRNVTGTIALLPGRAPAEAVLLDDVLTTGATLSECARVLREGGASRVCALTVAVDE